MQQPSGNQTVAAVIFAMKRLLFSFCFFVINVFAFSQVRIDWQQCYGSMGMDQANRLVKKHNGYRITGCVGERSGMITIPLESCSWIIDIDETGNVVKEISLDCYARRDEDFFADYYRVYDYALGLPPNELGKEQLGIKKLDANGDAVWETLVGCENKAFWYFVHGVSTPDGGVIASTTTQWGGGDITNYYGWNDAWVVKIDSLGRLEWETTLGTENSEFPECFINASDGGYYVGISGDPGYVGSIPVCRVPSTDEFDVLFIKLDTDGSLLWSRCYGGSKWDVIAQIVELEDGFLLVCSSESDDRDAEGAGYHLGYINNHPAYGQTSDIWLVRTDLDGNIVWSHCFGGTGQDLPTKAFQNEDGGFTVFGSTCSIDGDAQSSQNLHFPWDEYVYLKLWVFRTDADGNLLWERALGTKMGRYIYLEDVVKLSDREYTILATAEPPAEGCEGDFSCTNWDNFLCGYDSYWVLHITDIFDYDDVEEGKVEETSVSLYPNPTQGLLTVSGKGLRQVSLYNLFGQQVAAIPSYNSINAMVDTSGFAAGIYIVRVHTENGVYLKRVVVAK